MAKFSSGGSFQEKNRMCPHCRMEISFFATKCRFCGEALGRPKEEIRQLTIHDLGGENSSQYTPGEDVVGALESFRQEELARQEQQETRRSWFGQKEKKPAASGPVSPYNELPGLDPSSRELSGVTGFQRRPVRQESLLTKKLAMLGAFIATIIILYFGGGFVKAKYDDYIARRNAKPVEYVDNPAMAILQSGGSPVDALEAAMSALQQANNADNIEVAEKVRQVLIEQVGDLLNADPWDPSQLEKASNMAARAVQIDPDTPALGDLSEEVRTEVFAYKMSIKSIDSASETVTLRIMYADRPEDLVIKRKGEKVLNRFEVKSVTRDSVRLSDLQRKTKNGLNREFRLFADGSVKPV